MPKEEDDPHCGVLCAHCDLAPAEHAVDGKCPFASTTYVEGTTKRVLLQAPDQYMLVRWEPSQKQEKP